MIVYLLVGFWLGMYGFIPKEELMVCLCFLSIFETIGESAAIIINWGYIKKSFKNQFSQTGNMVKKAEESKDDSN